MKTRPYITERLLMGRKESNKTEKPVMVRVLSDQSLNIDQLVRVLYFGLWFMVVCDQSVSP